MVAWSLPPPHPGELSSSSGRAMQITRIGASRLQSVSWSTRSRKLGSAQWTSSSTTISGRSSAEPFEEPPHGPRDLLGGRGQPRTTAHHRCHARGDLVGGRVGGNQGRERRGQIGRVGTHRPSASRTTSINGQ